MSFTGDVSSDFIGVGAVLVVDPCGRSIIMPEQYPDGATSGWDVKSVAFYYDYPADIMYVGIDYYGIAGDADGDGDPGRAGDILVGLGGTDLPDLNSSEMIAVFFDTDMDGNYDVMAGDNTTEGINAFGTYAISNESGSRDMVLLPQVPSNLYSTPGPLSPDLEFTIAQFSEMPGLARDPGSPLRFRFYVYSGSLRDMAFGEDIVPSIDGEIIEIPIPASTGALDPDGAVSIEGPDANAEDHRATGGVV